MHNYSYLIHRCSEFTLTALKEVEEKTIEALQTSAATSLIKTLQMIRLNKMILAAGMFSVFEAKIQDSLNCDNGFVEAKNILKKANKTLLLNKFLDMELSVNSLKHGRGRSYNALVAKSGGMLRAQVKKPTDTFFNEGDVSEISGLIEIDDTFIYDCVEIIRELSEAILEERPDVFL